MAEIKVTLKNGNERFVITNAALTVRDLLRSHLGMANIAGTSVKRDGVRLSLSDQVRPGDSVSLADCSELPVEVSITELGRGRATVTLEAGATVGDALSAGGFDPNGKQLFVDGGPVNSDSTLPSGAVRLTLSQATKAGN